MKRLFPRVLVLTTVASFYWPGLRAATFDIADGDINAFSAAITSANSNNQDDTINLAAGGLYIFGSLPQITADNGHSLTINGNNSRLHPDSGFFFYVETRFFDINSYKFGAANSVNLNSMILDGGDPTPDPGDFSYGGAVRIRSGSIVNVTGCTFFRSVADRGGAISNLGVLTVNDSTFTSNEAGIGAAIYNRASLTVNGCTFVANRGSNGGVVANQIYFSTETPRATLKNCTLSDNNTGSQTGGGAIFNAGFGSSNPTSGSVTLISCTLSHSDLSNYAEVLNSELPPDLTISLADTILVDCRLYNQGYPSTNPSERILSSGFNLSNGDGNGFLNNIGDQINADPKFDPAGLQKNGNPGGTLTFALVEGSPAIDAGKRFDNVTTDQRGAFRPTNFAAIPDAPGGDGSDIGAYEATDFIPANPGQLKVTVNVDHSDGVCGIYDCTLRDAIERANAVAGDDTITFASGLTGTIPLSSALPDLTTNIMIVGPGARTLAVSGNNLYRVFLVPSSTTCSISGLTIRDGSDVSAFGAGLGGGIFNQGNLTLSDCALTANRAQGTSAIIGTGESGNGGGIYNNGMLNANRCTLDNNSATGGRGSNRTNFPARSAGPGGTANGAAIFNDTAGVMTLINCTIANNTLTGGAGGNGGTGGPGANGGAANGSLFNQGTLTLTSCTIAANAGTGGAGGTGTTNGSNGSATAGLVQSSSGGITTLGNTISAGNTSPDVTGSFASQGYNFIGNVGSATGFTATGDQAGGNGNPVLNPLLGPLQNNGGPTNTMALAINSPPLDKGKSFGLSLDQRGQLRTLDSPVTANASAGDGTDIGAFEFIPLNGADTDGDGMSNDFETFYGFNPGDPSDGALDSDGDGLTNSQEYQAGTNPRDPNSSLRITAAAKNGNDFSVTFSLAVAGKTYRLKRKDALSDPMWGSINGVADVIPTLSGPAQVMDVNGATATKRFYRIELVPQF